MRVRGTAEPKDLPRPRAGDRNGYHQAINPKMTEWVRGTWT